MHILLALGVHGERVPGTSRRGSFEPQPRPEGEAAGDLADRRSEVEQDGGHAFLVAPARRSHGHADPYGAAEIFQRFRPQSRAGGRHRRAATRASIRWPFTASTAARQHGHDVEREVGLGAEQQSPRPRSHGSARAFAARDVGRMRPAEDHRHVAQHRARLRRRTQGSPRRARCQPHLPFRNSRRSVTVPWCSISSPSAKATIGQAVRRSLTALGSMIGMAASRPGVKLHEPRPFCAPLASCARAP